MQTYEVGIKTRKPRFIVADKMEVDSRGALVFKNKLDKKYVIILIVNAQKWDYVQLQDGIKWDIGVEIE